MLMSGPQMLSLFWKMAHSSDATTDMLEQTLAAHVKILDCSWTQFSGQQKIRWLEESVVALKANEKWVLPALKQITEICSLYQVTILILLGDLCYTVGLGTMYVWSKSCSAYTQWLDQFYLLGLIQEKEQPTARLQGVTPVAVNRSDVIKKLEKSHTLVGLVVDNLTQYMAGVRAGGPAVADQDPLQFRPDGRYHHTAQARQYNINR